tara:strand:- start:1290 stop:1676 length:387 start_codon:yes stop_codon:yes gene_type:complete
MNSLKDKKILVVEDEKDLRDILAAVLENLVSEVFVAENGEKALQILETESVDLILSDVQMPVMGGFELTKRVRSKNLLIPVILLISGQSDLTEQSACSIGASGLMTKPCDIKTLRNKIMLLLNPPSVA